MRLSTDTGRFGAVQLATDARTRRWSAASIACRVDSSCASGTPDCCPDYHSHCSGGGSGYGRYVPAERPGDVWQPPPPLSLRGTMGCLPRGRRAHIVDNTVLPQK